MELASNNSNIMTEIKLLLNRCLLTEIKVCTSTQDTVYLFAYVVIYCAVQFLKQTRKTKVRNHRKETFPWISPVNKCKYLTNSRLFYERRCHFPSITSGVVSSSVLGVITWLQFYCTVIANAVVKLFMYYVYFHCHQQFSLF